jgi:hypothetical protein
MIGLPRWHVRRRKQSPANVRALPITRHGTHRSRTAGMARFGASRVPPVAHAVGPEGLLLGACTQVQLRDPRAGSEPAEVSHDGWDSEDEAYSFRYHHPDTGAGLLLKAVRMGDTLMLSTLSTSHPEVRFFEVE